MQNHKLQNHKAAAVSCHVRGTQVARCCHSLSCRGNGETENSHLRPAVLRKPIFKPNGGAMSSIVHLTCSDWFVWEHICKNIEQKGASRTVNHTEHKNTFPKGSQRHATVKREKNILLTIKLITIITLQYSNCYLFFKMSAFLIRTAIIMTICWRAADILKKKNHKAEIHGCQTSIITF